MPQAGLKRQFFPGEPSVDTLCLVPSAFSSCSDRAACVLTWHPRTVTDDDVVPAFSGSLPAPMTVAQIREAESVALSHASEDTLMDRAARAVARVVKDELTRSGRLVPNANIVVLAGSGRNGGDALLAGALLAAEGADVSGVEVTVTAHARGREALDAAGGRPLSAVAESGIRAADAVLAEADVVIDGIAGIRGHRGPPVTRRSLGGSDSCGNHHCLR